MKKIFLTLLMCLLITTGCESEKEESKKIVESESMLSYTIDGEKTDKKPSKEDGYIVNKIICDNGTDMMWDNDNWEVEFTKINSKDRCKVDFTKDVSTPGYRVTVTSNMTNALDSLSKAATLNGTVKIYSKMGIKEVTGCNALIEGNNVIVSNITSNQTCNIKINLKRLADVIVTAYPPKSGRTNFSVIDDGTPALYTGSDDQGTTYYFSGNGSTMNNWVSFAGKMWRIIRRNGNNSVRLLYAGDGMNSNDLSNSFSGNSYNNSNNHPAYVGWKYTLGGSLAGDRENGAKSTIYAVVERWYNSLSDDDKNYIDKNAIYCNDRNLASESTYTTSEMFYYSAYERFMKTKGTPIFKCNNSNDRFTIFGLMTADEVVAAGGVRGISNKKAYYYLAKDGISSITAEKAWWTMTPGQFRNQIASVFYVLGSSGNSIYGDYPGSLNSNNNGVSSAYVFTRPVISLKVSVLVTGGDGSGNNPYTVTLP